VKIGIDATSVWGLKDGLLNGMIAYTVHLTRNLLTKDDPDCDYIVYCRDKVPEVFADVQDRAVFVPLPSGNRKILQQWSLPRAASRDAVDVIFYPYNSAALFFSPPSVVTIHDLHPFVIEDRFQRIHSTEQHGNTIASGINQRYWKFILRESSRRAGRVIAVSATTKEDIVSIFGTSPDRVDVVHEAVDGARFNIDRDTVERSSFLGKHRLPDRYLLAVGTHAYKNIEGIVAAFETLRATSGHSVGLVIAGNIATVGADILESIRGSAYSDDIVLTGFFPDSDLKYLYQFSELFLFPSFYEGFGLPILEAFACGTPVVTSATGAMPEVAGEAALLVDPDNHDEIAAAVRQVLDDGGRRQELVRRGLERAAQFTWSRAAEETRAILKRVAGER